MFICLGSICRNSIAEIIFRDMVRKAGRRDDLRIASSATSSKNVWNVVGARRVTDLAVEIQRRAIAGDRRTARLCHERCSD